MDKEMFDCKQVYANKSHMPSYTNEKNDLEATKISPIKLGQLVKCSHHGIFGISVLEVVGIIMTISENKPYFSYYLRGMRGNQSVNFYSFGQCYISPLYCSNKSELQRIRIKWC